MRLICLLLSLGFGGLAFAQDIKLSQYPKVYRGDEGLTVTVAEVMPKEKKQALIQIKGIDDDIDGKVYLYTIKVQGTAQAYVWTNDGQEKTRMRADDGYWFKRYTVYLPGAQKPSYVIYDEKLSEKANANTLLKQYQKDKTEQAMLATFNRKANEKHHEDELKSIDISVRESCGGNVTTKIHWPSISDEQLKTYSIHSFCGQVSDSLAHLCRNHSDLKKSAAKITHVDCKFTEKLRLTRSGPKINIDVNPETGNQDDFVRNYLQNEL